LTRHNYVDINPSCQSTLSASRRQAKQRKNKGVANAGDDRKDHAVPGFDNEAEEAAKFYVSVFKNSKLGKVSRYGKEGFEVHGRPAGTVMTAEFELEGQKLVALNGGPHFKFNEAVSFQISCDSQEEVDYFWSKLCEGGEESQCGWLKDKFGLSWQVIPKVLPELLMNENSEKARRAMRAMLQMRKIDIAALKAAQAA
jgi:predicted 3-demethylubiquinone-9 3-methyltransferase (glyoxalase superfamily)